jgi:hypothetical protein
MAWRRPGRGRRSDRDDALTPRATSLHTPTATVRASSSPDQFAVCVIQTFGGFKI